MKSLIAKKEEELKKLISDVGDKLVEQIVQSGKHKAIRIAVDNFRKN